MKGTVDLWQKKNKNSKSKKKKKLTKKKLFENRFFADDQPSAAIAADAQSQVINQGTRQ